MQWFRHVPVRRWAPVWSVVSRHCHLGGLWGAHSTLRVDSFQGVLTRQPLSSCVPIHTSQRPKRQRVRVRAHNGGAKSIQMRGPWSGCRISRVSNMRHALSGPHVSCNQVTHTRYRPQRLPWWSFVSSKTTTGSSSKKALSQSIDLPQPGSSSQHTQKAVHNLTRCHHVPQDARDHTADQTTHIHYWTCSPYAILRQ